MGEAVSRSPVVLYAKMSPRVETASKYPPGTVARERGAEPVVSRGLCLLGE